jgi:hypothetical protein
MRLRFVSWRDGVVVGVLLNLLGCYSGQQLLALLRGDGWSPAFNSSAVSRLLVSVLTCRLVVCEREEQLPVLVSAVSKI